VPHTVHVLVLTIDQQRSRTGQDRVPGLLRALEAVPVRAAFERTVGDELRGVPQGAEAAYQAIRVATRDGDWHVGLGAGPGELDDGASTRAGRGPAFLHARQAVEAAKGSHVSLAVRAPDARAAARAQAVLRLLACLLGRRTPAQWEAVDLLEEGLSGHEAATRLGISDQALSQRRLTSGLEEEVGARPYVIDLLRALDTPAQGPVPSSGKR